MEPYLSLHCLVPERVEPELPEILQRWPVLGCQVGQADAGAVPITVYLRARDQVLSDQIRTVLLDCGGVDFRLAAVGDEDWLAEYRQRVRAFAVGDRWWIDPHPEAPEPAPEGRLRLVMPPRTAFGSGSHESTRLVLSILERADPAGLRVLDVGTGSGILALAVDRQGAATVLGVDLDALAVEIAREIAGVQDWSPRVRFAVGSAGCAAPGWWQLVVCNMISESIVALLGDLEACLAVRGSLVLSGLLCSEREMILTELGRRELTVRREESLGGWLALVAERRP